MFTKTAALTAMAVSAIAASPAMADTRLEGVALKPWNSEFAQPIVVQVERHKGKLRVKDSTVDVPIRIGGVIKNVIKQYQITHADIQLEGFPYVSWFNVARGGRNINQNTVLNLSAHQSQPFTKQALAICEKHPGRAPKQYPLNVFARLKVEAGKVSGGEVKQKVTRHASTTIKASVNCPGNVPDRTPVDPDADPIPPKVKSVSVNIVRLGEACPAKIILVARFETDRQGKIEAMLRRSDGETDSRTLKAEKYSGGYRADWTRTYTFGDNVTRKYMAEAVGQGKISAWKDMIVRCGDSPGGGEGGKVKAK